MLAENSLCDIAKEIFQKYLGLKKFIVRGYTPGFNDGEPCEHSSASSVGIFTIESSWRNNGTYYASSSDELDGRGLV